MGLLTPRRVARLAAKIFGAVFLVIVLALGVGVAVTWAPDRTAEDLAARWAPPPSTFIDVMGMRVHLRDEGPRTDPTPVVLLHGTSASLHTWEGWSERLRDRRRVISFDLPGFGLTGPFPDGDFTMKHYVRFVAAVMDHLGVEHFVLAGNSFGGEIAWSTAVEHPGRVDRLILVDSAGYPPRAQSTPIGFRIAKLPLINRLALVSLPRSIIASSLRNVYGDPSKVTAELIDRYYDLTLREGNRASLRQRFEQSPPGAGQDRIREVKTRTFILWGGRDRLIPVENAHRFAADIEGSELVVIDDLGHVPQEEDPARTVAAVIPFLGTPQPRVPE